MTDLRHLGALAIAMMVTLWPASSFGRIIVFGDSLSDTGNAFIASDMLPAEPAARERFSNGPVWVEHVAEALDLGAAPALAGGTNYAFGGARTGPAGDQPPSLIDQVDRYLTERNANSDALHVLWAGANDLLQAIAGQESPPAVAEAVVGNIEAALRRLTDAGAHRFLILNMPDIGRTPHVRAQGPAAAERGTALAAAFNRRLKVTLDGLEANLPAGILRIDVFDLMHAALADPEAFGILNVTDPCRTVEGTCARPDAHLFWDGVHPTAAAHQRLGQAVLNALASQRPSAATGQ
ncbi:MAG TPA: SGNH/GDSL hydrolase family protein [Alphaproteobacteria bacterium]|nr:SGNH/GDSL hydrolase family protein [Alphaproteobacteria bacterium]